MKTLRLTVDADHPHSPASRKALALAAEILRGGGLVAFPTETVYGLGANALQANAVAGIFRAKQRPAWDPVIAHVSGMEMLDQLTAGAPECAHRLMERFWPGPLTLLLPRGPQVPPAVTAGRPRVGVRMPSHPVALELIRLAAVPIAAPSANSFGRTSPTTAAHVLEDLDGRIDAVLDGGPTSHGLESTVLDACESPMLLYRPGVVTLEQINAICPAVAYRAPDVSKTEPEALPSPGVGIRHYAPRARLVLVDASPGGAALSEALARFQGEKAGVMLPDGFALEGGDALIYRWGAWTNEAELAQRLFAGLRELDARGATVILCPLPPDSGLGRAILDRLSKAAREK